MQSLPVPDGVIKQVIRGIFVAQLEGLKKQLNIKTADELTTTTNRERRSPFRRENHDERNRRAFPAASNCSIAANSSRRMRKWRRP